jgi:hypothetical protein
VRRDLSWLRDNGVPAWIVLLMEKDPTILAAQPRNKPIVYTRTNGCRLAEWLVAALEERGHVVNATPSEYPNEVK